MNLIAAAIIGIAIIVLLIAVCKVHPFLSLLAGSFAMAVCAGVEYDKAFDSFTSGVGSTIANVGLLIAFGSIIGTILFKSGGADTIVDTIMSKTPLQRLPWAMALIAFIVGIPMFFEVGVVILIPVVLFAARRAKAPVVLLGIPALAGLSTLHAFVPPHPGPLTAIGALNANLGITLALGLIVAIPTVIISGPLFGKLAAKWVPIAAPENTAEAEAPKSADACRFRHWRRDRQFDHRIRHESADRRLAGRRAHPPGNRLRNRRHRHRIRHYGAARHRHEPDASGDAGARHRRRFRILLAPE